MNFVKIKRSLVVLYSFLFFGVGSLILALVVFPIAKLCLKKEFCREYLCGLIHNLWAFFTRFLINNKTITLDISSQDKDCLSEMRGKIIVANHPSFIDIVLLIGLIPHSLCVVKNDIKNNFIMSNIVKSLYLVNDEDNEKLIADAKEALDNGYNIIIFPSGTRTVEGEPLKLYKGAASMALHSDAEIIPINISTDYTFLAKGQKVYDAGEKPVEYSIKINEKIDVKNYKDLNLDDIKLRNLLTSVIKELIVLK